MNYTQEASFHFDLLDGEEFRPMVGRNDKYLISNKGRVASTLTSNWRLVKTTNRGTGKQVRIKKATSSGYEDVKIDNLLFTYFADYIEEVTGLQSAPLKTPYDTYIVRSNGDILNLKGNSISLLTPYTTNTGHQRVQVQANGTKKVVYFAQAVAEAFIPNENGYNFVMHKDGDKSNNHVNNLLWSKTNS